MANWPGSPGYYAGASIMIFLVAIVFALLPCAGPVLSVVQKTLAVSESPVVEVVGSDDDAIKYD